MSTTTQTDLWASLSPHHRSAIASIVTEDAVRNIDAAPLPPNEKLAALQRLLQDTLTTQQTTLGQTNPTTLDTMHTLALLHSHAGNHALAESTWTHIASTHAAAGTSERGLAARHNLAYAALQQGRYAEAEQRARELLPELRARVGDDSPQVLGAWRMLIEAVAGQGRWEEVGRLREEGWRAVRGMGGGRWGEYQGEEEVAMGEVEGKIEGMRAGVVAAAG